MNVGSQTRRLACAAAICAAVAGSLAVGERVFAQGSAVIRACMKNDGSVQIIGPVDSCKRNETLLTWNTQGPAGSPGPAGAVGPTGAQGPDGAPGRDGRDGKDGQAGGPPATLMSLMKVDGVTGINPTDTTPIFSFSLGATNTSGGGFGGGGGEGKANFADVSVLKMLDGFSVPLLKATATGIHIRTVEIQLFHVGETVAFATYGFNDATITSDLVGGSTSAISESLSFNYRKIVSDITLNGMTFHSCFDVALNASC